MTTDRRIGQLSPDAEGWFSRRTFRGTGDLPRLLAAKRAAGITVSVVLPALNEGATIGTICRVIRAELIREIELVDELLVVDSGSTDDTIQRAASEGATAYRADEILSQLPAASGKGEALWKSLAVARGDLLVFLDSDVRNFRAAFVTDLVAPLIENDQIVMTKAFYERPLEVAGDLTGGGARVTELAVRPLLNLLVPELAGVIQPLAGEYAARADAIRSLPFFTGYGVEIGLLIDVVNRFGLDALAQVDLGNRVHANRDLPALGKTSFEVLSALLARLDALGRIKLPEDLPETLLQFEGATPLPSELPMVERPPMASLTDQFR